MVTGGAHGIGRAVAERLVRAGAQVFVWDLAPADLDGATSLAVDVTDGDQLDAGLARTLEVAGRINVLVNNAGYLGPYGPFATLARHEQQRIIEVNLVGTLEVCRRVLPSMRQTGSGRIVTLGSLAGKEGLLDLPVYSAASAGVIAFTKSLAKELAETGIRVNCVAPGPIETDLILHLGPAVVASMIASSPMKRLGTVAEVAELVVWLCSDAATFSTGAVFDVSGGRASY